MNFVNMSAFLAYDMKYVGEHTNERVRVKRKCWAGDETNVNICNVVICRMRAYVFFSLLSYLFIKGLLNAFKLQLLHFVILFLAHSTQ